MLAALLLSFAPLMWAHAAAARDARAAPPCPHAASSGAAATAAAECAIASCCVWITAEATAPLLGSAPAPWLPLDLSDRPALARAPPAPPPRRG